MAGVDLVNHDDGSAQVRLEDAGHGVGNQDATDLGEPNDLAPRWLSPGLDLTEDSTSVWEPQEPYHGHRSLGSLAHTIIPISILWQDNLGWLNLSNMSSIRLTILLLDIANQFFSLIGPPTKARISRMLVQWCFPSPCEPGVQLFYDWRLLIKSFQISLGGCYNYYTSLYLILLVVSTHPKNKLILSITHPLRILFQTNIWTPPFWSNHI